MRKLPLLKIALCLSVVFSLSSCSKSGSNPQPKDNGSTLSITSLDVNSGPYYTRVTITGTGFSATPSEDKVAFNGHPATLEAILSSTSIVADVPLAAGTGNVTITVNGKTATGPVFTYQTAEVVTYVAGGYNTFGSADGAGNKSSFNQPTGLASDASGNIYVADEGNNLIRKITPDGIVTTIAGTGHQGHQDGPALSASFSGPHALAVDASGIIYIADQFNSLIRKLTPDGQVSTLAGNILINQPVDGTGSSAGFGRPLGIVVDDSGNLFVADQGAGRIRKVTQAGVVTTVYAGNSIAPYSLVLDKGGNIIITDETANNLAKITQSGVYSGFAGGSSIIGGSTDGTGNAAGFYGPNGLAIDGNGNIYVLDRGNGLIRKVTPAAVVTTLGGRDAINQYGPLATISFMAIDGITIDPSGNIYIIANNEIRKISLQ